MEEMADLEGLGVVELEKLWEAAKLRQRDFPENRRNDG
jgi:hypothetical protein